MLARAGDRLDRAVAALVAALLGIMVVAVTWQVVSRYVLGNPSSWTEELARFLLIWIGLFGGSLAYRRRLHLGLDLLAERLAKHPGASGRLRRLHQRVIDACVLVFAVTVLIGGGSSLVGLTYELAQYSPALGLPMSVVYLSLPLSGLLTAIWALAALTSAAGDAA